MHRFESAAFIKEEVILYSRNIHLELSAICIGHGWSVQDVFQADNRFWPESDVILKMTAFWDIVPCSLIGVD
jgi:hypothetical protein